MHVNFQELIQEQGQGISQLSFFNSIEEIQHLFPKINFIKMYEFLENQDLPQTKWNALGIEKIGFLNDSKSDSLYDLRNAIIEKTEKENAHIYLNSSYETQVSRLEAIFNDGTNLNKKMRMKSKPLKKKIHILHSKQRDSFCLPKINFYFINDHDILSSKPRTAVRFKHLESEVIDKFTDLQEGDYIVHISHGIGRFVKLQNMETEGQKKDFPTLRICRP